MRYNSFQSEGISVVSISWGRTPSRERYSFNAEDFQKIYKLLNKEPGDLIPHSYMVTLNNEVGRKLQNLSITPIYTDGTYFIHILKRKLIDEDLIIDDAIDDYAEDMLEIVKKVHYETMKEFAIPINPNILHIYVYQDGLIDALHRFMVKKILANIIINTIFMDG